MSFNPLGQLRAMGVSETPDIKALPWDKPDAGEMRKDARMEKLRDWSMIVGLIGGLTGLYFTVQALRGR